jgi:flagellar biosynthesis protein FlhA
LKETAPALVDEMKPDTLRIGTLHQVLIKLLEEQFPVTDLARVLEAALNHAPTVKDPGQLADLVRRQLGRTVCDRFRDKQGRVRVLVLDPRVETALRDSLRDHELSLAPQPFERLIQSLSQHWQAANARSMDVALLTDQSLRRPVRKAIERALPDLPVLAYQEIPKDLQIEPQAMIRNDEVFPGTATASSAVAGERIADDLERELAVA